MGNNFAVDLFVIKYQDSEEKARELFEELLKMNFENLIVVLPESMMDMAEFPMGIEDKGQLYLDQGFEEKAFVVVFQRYNP